MGQGKHPVAAFSDPFAGEPLRGDATTPEVFSDPFAGEPLRMQTSRTRNLAADVAPSVGGLVGGIRGGVGGAAIGGAAGQGYGELIRRGGEIPGAIADVARNVFTEPVATIQGLHEGIAEGALGMAKSAGIEAVSQAAGNKVAQAGGALSKWLMNRATSRVTEKLMREFPDLSDTLIDNALTVSKGGYAKALELLKAAKDKAAAALSVADQSGATIPVQMTTDVAESLKTAILEQTIKQRGVPPSQGAITAASNRLPAHLRSLFQQIDTAATSGGAMDLTPSQADILKRRLQQESKALYAQRGAPNGPRAMGMDATERAELASQINAAIDQAANGYKAANTEAQPLIGAVRGIKQATRSNGSVYQAMVRPGIGAAMGGAAGYSQEGGPGALVGAMAGAAMTSPAGMSREAIILKDPKVQELLRQMPRATAMALVELLRQRSGEPEAAPVPQE